MPNTTVTHIRDPQGEAGELRIAHKREPVRYVRIAPALCGVSRPVETLHTTHSMYVEYCPDCLSKSGR